jgi:hypothetical protein
MFQKISCAGLAIARLIATGSLLVLPAAPASAARMSFNLQYLTLQSSMQNDNRQFTMVSNIMKTKHDTAKNSIRNIR